MAETEKELQKEIKWRKKAIPKLWHSIYTLRKRVRQIKAELRELEGAKNA